MDDTVQKLQGSTCDIQLSEHHNY